MNEFLQYSILGVVQGITEWLPVSSSGHLVLFNELLGIEQNLGLSVLLHLASLAVLLIYFRKEIWQLIRALLDTSMKQERLYILQIIIATMITVTVALYLRLYVPMLQTTIAVAWFLLLTSILVAATKLVKQRRELTWNIVLALGLVQGLAVLPGLSRSGSMIGLAMLLGIKKDEAFRFAFLAGIPAIFGAFVWEVRHIEFNAPALLGFLVAFVVGYAALRVLEIVLKRDKFHLFAFYTFALAVMLLFL